MLAELPGPPEGFADRVLDEVETRRGFLSPSQRRLVTRGRLAAAAVLLVSFGGLMLVTRTAPGLFELRERPSPIAGFDDAVRREALPGAMASAERLAGELERSTAPLVAVFRGGAIPAFPASTAPGAAHAAAARGPASDAASGLDTAPAITWHPKPDPGEADPYARHPVAGEAGTLWSAGLFGGDGSGAVARRRGDAGPGDHEVVTAVLVPESADAMYGATRYDPSSRGGEMVIRIRVPAARSAHWVREKLGLDESGRPVRIEQPPPAPAGESGAPRW
jgi:hypothetical protein